MPGGYCGGPTAAAILAGDKIGVLTQWNNSDGSYRPGLMQINSDGTPDNTAFGSSFAIRMPNPDTTKVSWRTGGRLLIDASGNWLISGTKCDGGWNSTPEVSACTSVVGRITPTGAWDTTFGSGGYSNFTFGTTQNPPQEQYFFGLAFDASHNIIATGWDENYAHATLAKFSGTNGLADTSFGTSGRLSQTIVSGASAQEAQEATVDEDGNILMAGYANSGGSLAVNARFSATGAIDTTYGTSGIHTTSTSGIDPRLVLQPDGRLVIISAQPRTGGSDVAAWRFWP
jgi:uncharacterized delta-60 repeat protein